MIKRLCPIVGFLCIIGVANDTASYTEIALCVTTGAILITIGIYFMAKEYERSLKYILLRFISPTGKFRMIRAKTYAGRNKAIRDLTAQGYILYSEAEVKEEIK